MALGELFEIEVEDRLGPFSALEQCIGTVLLDKGVGVVLGGKRAAARVEAKLVRGPRPLLFNPTDWRNGSASDSSPEGYVFESRIGHSSTEPRWSGGWTSVPQPFRDGAVRFRLGCYCWIGVVVITSALHAVGHRFEPGIQ